MDLASERPRRYRPWGVEQKSPTARRRACSSSCSLFAAALVQTVRGDLPWRLIISWRLAGLAPLNYQSSAEGKPQVWQSCLSPPRELLFGLLVGSARSPERMRSDCDRASTEDARRSANPVEYAISVHGGALIFQLPEYPKGVRLG